MGSGAPPRAAGAAARWGRREGKKTGDPWEDPGPPPEPRPKERGKLNDPGWQGWRGTGWGTYDNHGKRT